ncbi:MAG TPA: DUF502 domain-containing protein [Phycisphaerales bacterium]|nr:DUF502 domain-containing protein [Phycisphaerales bacterium]
MARTHHGFWSDFKLFFIRGLAVLLPSIVTLWLLFQAFIFLYNNVAAPINAGIRLGIVQITPRIFKEGDLPEWFRVTSLDVDALRESTTDPVLQNADDAALRLHIRTQSLERYWNTWGFGFLRLTGLLVAVVLLYLGGRLLGSFFGRFLFARFEALLRAVPGFKQVYPHVKQVVDLIMGDSQMAFRRVVLVEYPRKGIWTIGLVTSSSLKAVTDEIQSEALTVFIPTSPTPFTGFTINVPVDDCVDVDMTVEQALRFVITAGVLVPDKQQMPAASGVPQIHVVVNPEPKLGSDEEQASKAEPEDAP